MYGLGLFEFLIVGFLFLLIVGGIVAAVRRTKK